MRRKERYIATGALLLGGGTALCDVIKQWWEKHQKGQKLTWENYNGHQTLKAAFRNTIIGGGMGYAYYQYCLQVENELPFNSDRYLKDLLTKEHLKNNSAYLAKTITFKKNLQEKLFQQFRDKLICYPLDGGSFIKRTAILSKYDLDIVLPFSRHSYPTLEEMYYDVYKILVTTFGHYAQVQKHSKAIGISFGLKSGDLIDFDIVPGREIGDFEKDKNLNFYIRPDWIWQRGSSFKANYAQQRNITTNKPEVRKVIKLLKIYRKQNGLNLPTVVIEQCSVEALSEINFGINMSLTENLINAMNLLSCRLSQNFLVDFTNSNNNLNCKMSNSERHYISDLLVRDIKGIERDPKYIKEVFGS